MTRNEIFLLRKKVYSFFRTHGRDLPWRKTKDPYKVFLSEVMLQQTQVGRVEKKYFEFLERFPDWGSLAGASSQDVLRVWSGLGYNRRALYLRASASVVLNTYKGRLPRSPLLLEAFPGVGKATAASVCVFAFNKPLLFIETNIRSVYIHEFFPKRRKVGDKEIIPLLAETLDIKNPRLWYSALMDYGSFLKKNTKNPSRKSTHHTKQMPFRGSNRELRGKILREILSGKVKPARVAKSLNISFRRAEELIATLRREGFDI